MVRSRYYIGSKPFGLTRNVDRSSYDLPLGVEFSRSTYSLPEGSSNSEMQHRDAYRAFSGKELSGEAEYFLEAFYARPHAPWQGPENGPQQ